MGDGFFTTRHLFVLKYRYMYYKNITTSAYWRYQMFETGLDQNGWNTLEFWQTSFDSNNRFYKSKLKEKLRGLDLDSNWWLGQVAIGNLRTLQPYVPGKLVYYVHEEWVKAALLKCLYI